MARFQGVESVPLSSVIWVDSGKIFDKTPSSFCLISNIKFEFGQKGVFFLNFAAQIDSSDKTCCDLSVANCGGYFSLIYMRAPDRWRKIGRKSTYTLRFSVSSNFCFGLVKFLSINLRFLVPCWWCCCCVGDAHCTAGTTVQFWQTCYFFIVRFLFCSFSDFCSLVPTLVQLCTLRIRRSRAGSPAHHYFPFEVRRGEKGKLWFLWK